MDAIAAPGGRFDGSNAHVYFHHVTNCTIHHHHYYGQERRPVAAQPLEAEAMAVDAPPHPVGPQPDAHRSPTAPVSAPSPSKKTSGPRTRRRATVDDPDDGRGPSDDDAMDTGGRSDDDAMDIGGQGRKKRGAQDLRSDDLAEGLTEAEQDIIIKYLPEIIEDRYKPLQSACASARQRGQASDIRQFSTNDIQNIKKSQWFREHVKRREVNATLLAGCEGRRARAPAPTHSAAVGAPSTRQADDPVDADSDSDSDAGDYQPDDLTETELTATERTIIERYQEDMKNGSFKQACRAFRKAHLVNPRQVRALRTDALRRISELPWFTKLTSRLELAKQFARNNAGIREGQRREDARKESGRKEAERREASPVHAVSQRLGKRAHFTSKMPPFSAEERRFVEVYLVEHHGQGIDLTDLVRKFRSTASKHAKEVTRRGGDDAQRVFRQRNPVTLKKWTRLEYPDHEYYEGR